MRIADLRILLFDLGEAILPSRPQSNCASRVDRRSRMAAAWRPPEGLVLDGREHGGRLWRGGEEGDHRRLWLPASASRVPYSVWEVEAGSPSKTLLSAPSESVILLSHPHRLQDLRCGRGRPLLGGGARSS